MKLPRIVSEMKAGRGRRSDAPRDLTRTLESGEHGADKAEESHRRQRGEVDEEEEDEERSRLLLKSAHEVDDEAEDGELDRQDRQVGQGLGEDDGARAIHGKGLVLGEDGAAFEGGGGLGEGDERGEQE